jgi:hypothetical protein
VLNQFWKLKILAPREELPRAAPYVPTRTQNTGISISKRPKSHFCRFLVNFLPIKKSFKKLYFRKPPKISKIEPEVARGVHFRSFRMPFDIPFSINFLIFSQSAKTLFLNNSMVL